jgi:hypothetical protein
MGCDRALCKPRILSVATVDGIPCSAAQSASSPHSPSLLEGEGLKLLPLTATTMRSPCLQCLSQHEEIAGQAPSSPPFPTTRLCQRNHHLSVALLDSPNRASPTRTALFLACPIPRPLICSSTESWYESLSQPTNGPHQHSNGSTSRCLWDHGSEPARPVAMEDYRWTLRFSRRHRYPRCRGSTVWEV